MQVTETLISEMIETLEFELGDEHYELCTSLEDASSKQETRILWKAIERSHLNVLQTYLRVVVGSEGISLLLNEFETEEELHSYICDETEFCLNEPFFDALYEFIPELLEYVEELRQVDLINDSIVVERAS